MCVCVSVCSVSTSTSVHASIQHKHLAFINVAEFSWHLCASVLRAQIMADRYASAALGKAAKSTAYLRIVGADTYAHAHCII